MKLRVRLIISLLVLCMTTCGCELEQRQEKKEERIGNMQILINDKEYIMDLEDSETLKSFLELLPIEMEMSELNGNEKYGYLASSLPTNDSKIGHIKTGDVMLYNGNCLVIFYKDFDTSYSYTRIGHIRDLTDISKTNVTLKIDAK